jgi:hypothetical protein
VIQRRATRLLPGLAFATTLLASVLGFGVWSDRTAGSATAQAMGSLDRDLAREGWSAEVRQVAAWAIRTNDHRGLPFLVIDQVHARLFAFDGSGRLAGSTPILRNPVDDELTPAGRFVADSRRSARAGVIVWANEHDTLSLDGAPPPPQHEHDPLAAGFHHRWGSSLHVASDFYQRHLHAFRHQASVAYVLPAEPGVHRSHRVYAVQPQPADHQRRNES